MLYSKLFIMLQYLQSQAKTVDGINPDFAKDLNGTPYAFLSGAVTDQTLQINNAKYRVIEHHISMYNQYDRTQPHLSEYHYTAILEDKNKVKHQLHVYFNEQEVCERVTFKRMDDPERLIDFSDEAKSACVDLAEKLTNRCMLSLRKELLVYEHALQEKYKESENNAAILHEALAENNYLQYVEYLDDMLLHLKSLKTLNSRRYESVHNFVHALREKIIKRFSEGVKINRLEEKEEKEEKETAEINNNLLESIDNVQEKSDGKEDLNEFIEKISQQYEMLVNIQSVQSMKKLDPKWVDNFLSIYDEMNVLTTLFSTSSVLVSMDNARRLMQTYNKINKDIGRLVVIAFLTKDLISVKKLLQINKNIPSNYLLTALRLGDHELLKLFLDEDVFSKTQSYYDPKSGTHYSMLQVLYDSVSKDTQKKDIAQDQGTKKKLACVELILSKDCNVLLCDGKEGLPWGYWLYSHAIFREKLSGMVFGSSIFSKMIEKLSALIKRNPKHAGLKEFLDFCRRHRLVSQAVPRSFRLSGEYKELSSNLSSECKEGVAERLKTDPEIQAYAKKIEAGYLAYSRNNTSMQKHRELNASMKKAVDVVGFIQSNSLLKDDNFDSAKSEAIQYCKDTLNALDWSASLVRVQESIKKLKNTKMKKMNRLHKQEYNDLRNQERDLLNALNTYKRNNASETLEDSYGIMNTFTAFLKRGGSAIDMVGRLGSLVLHAESHLTSGSATLIIEMLAEGMSHDLSIRPEMENLLLDDLISPESLKIMKAYEGRVERFERFLRQGMFEIIHSVSGECIELNKAFMSSNMRAVSIDDEKAMKLLAGSMQSLGLKIRDLHSQSNLEEVFSIIQSMLDLGMRSEKMFEDLRKPGGEEKNANNRLTLNTDPDDLDALAATTGSLEIDETSESGELAKICRRFR